MFSSFVCNDIQMMDIIISVFFHVFFNFHLTDINYADDAVLFTDDPTKWDYVFRNFEASAAVVGLTQTGIKRRSKILELELLQEQSILTIKQ